MNQDGDAVAHVWRVGELKTDDVPTHLFRICRAAANSAIAALSSTDAERVLWCATALGLALETAIKFSIAKANVVLLADPKYPTSAVALARADRSPLDVAALRTVNGLAALELLKLVHKGDLRVPGQVDAKSVFNVRNSALHMGAVDPVELRRAARNAVQAIEVILFDLERLGEEEEESFWDDSNSELVYQLIDQKSSESAVSLSAKLASARVRLAALQRSLGSDWQTVLRTIHLGRRKLWDGEEFVAFPCPVCSAEGVLARYISDPDADFGSYSWRYREDEYSVPSLPSGTRYAYPESFTCLFCELELDSDEIALLASFEPILEEELEPSEEFLERLRDWESEAEHRRRMEEFYEELRAEMRDDFV